jgi:hypothetical protein
MDQIDFLGYNIISLSITPLKHKIKAILNYKKPNIVYELRKF